MKGFFIGFSLICIFILQLYLPSSYAMYGNICRLFANGAVIRDPYACNAYITCTNSVGVSTTCPNGQLFSIETKKCVASNATCDDPCAPDFDNIWAADPKSCNGYYYCVAGNGNLGTCPNNLHFDEDKQQCVYPWNSDCEGDNFCHIVPNKVNFKDESACDMYYYCDSGVLKSKSCASGQLYSQELGKCAATATVNGCDSMPSNICMNGKKIEKNKFVADKATCRGYYYCVDKGDVADEKPSWGQCPPDTFFEYASQSCTDPVKVACSADRCDGRTVKYVNSGKTCQYYLVCRDGIVYDEQQCANYNFFDEKRQGCTSEVIEYKACK